MTQQVEQGAAPGFLPRLMGARRAAELYLSFMAKSKADFHGGELERPRH
jgi:hypothetical protein